MFLDPGMIEPHVIGHKIEHQPQAALAEPLAQAGQRRIAAKISVYRIAGDRETGTGDVFLAQVRQCLLKFPAPLGIAARDLLRPPGQSARR